MGENNKKGKLIEYENKLLKNELLLKRSRIGALIFCVIYIIYLISQKSQNLFEDNFILNIFIIFLFIFIAWECTLKLRHIRTIKNYRSKKILE